jgi:Tfp pilus assembly protein PilN
VQVLQAQQKQYADLSNTKTSSAAIEAELAKLMGQDIKWYDLVPALRNAAAATGVTLTNISATLTPANAASSPAPGTTATAATVGNITITATTPDKTRVAAFLDALAKVPGLVNPYLNNLSTQGTGTQFSMQVGFTSALYQGRYTPAAK